MPSQASSPPLVAALLAALWLALGRCGGSEPLGPACDNGKAHLDRDLPSAAAHWGCSDRSRPESAQRLPAIDTVHDPQPARRVCMDQPIAYSHAIPNSGAFRPVMAESGEYWYCPPQRWLNNLHQGATILLYHPCAALPERRLLSGLARSCLPGHIITPHPQLSRDMPIALVSWGRTLELPTIASSNVCDWLQTTQTARNKVDGRTRTQRYNLLLTRSAGLQHLEQSAGSKDSVRQCCEETISSLLGGPTGALPPVKEDLKQIKEGRKIRAIQAAIGENRYASKRAENMTNDSSQINKSIPQRPADSQNHSSSLGPAVDPLPGQGPPLDPSLPTQTPQSEVRKQHRAFTSPPAPQLVSHNPESLRNINSSQHGGGDSVSDGTKGGDAGTSPVAQGSVKDHDVVEVEEREAGQSQKHRGKPLPDKDEKLRTASSSPSQIHTQSGHNCSDCTKSSGAESRTAALKTGLQRTPRTDEAAWAAAALGFLLVLLTLSVLHTRLYRHWRTTPSLYWRDPHEDYDSVADVIRRRLRIAKRRRKRGRRQECALLPSSSSSEENP
ncbi:uncharacterized protein tp53i13 isoform 1-T2 [Fundulus diaphanus]